MRSQIKKLSGKRGFSILEMLVALFLTGIITLSVYKVFLNQQYQYVKQDDITSIQQNARASIDELTRQIRMAGQGLPPGMQSIVASNTNPDTITISYKSVDCETYLSAAMPQPSAELKCGTDVSCFQENQWVYIFEPDSGGGEFFVLTHVQPGSNHLQHNTMTLSKKYGKDAQIMMITQMKFYIDNTTDKAHPKLMVKPVGRPASIYADNITDLQFKYKLANGSIVDVPVMSEDIREVQMSLNGRSNNPDYMDANRSYQNRTYASSVNVRNLSD